MESRVPPPIQLVQLDVACTRCGYSLRGLQITGKCPECSWSVEASLQGGLLRFAGPEYLASLVLGARIVIYTNIANLLAGLLLAGAAVVAIFAIGGFSPPPGGGGGGAVRVGAAPAWVTLGGAGISVLATTASLIGYWLLTAPDPANSQREQPRTARRVVRSAVAVSAAVQAIGLAVGYFGASITPAGAPMGPNPAIAVAVTSGAISLIGTIAGAVMFFATMLYVRWLAQRIPDEDMVEKTRTYMWLLPLLYTVGALCVGIGPLVAWVLYLILLWKLQRLVGLAREQSLTLSAA
jgi:hypothetical protein